MMTINSIIPQELSRSEVAEICTELFIARQWGKDHIIVHLSSVGLDYRLGVDRLADFQACNRTFYGGMTNVGTCTNK